MVCYQRGLPRLVFLDVVEIAKLQSFQLPPVQPMIKQIWKALYLSGCLLLFVRRDSHNKNKHVSDQTNFSKHRSSGPMLSISQNVQKFVCVSVCLFTFEEPFKRLFAPTS